MTTRGASLLYVLLLLDFRTSMDSNQVAQALMPEVKLCFWWAEALGMALAD
jgi:hypothetical protein